MAVWPITRCALPFPSFRSSYTGCFSLIAVLLFSGQRV